MARYLVGPYNNSWNFMDAIEKAQDGDTIEFENGYVFQWPTDEVIVIKSTRQGIWYLEESVFTNSLAHLRVSLGLPFA